jgi:nucleoside-diphosphate-sugar epimerase
MNVTIVRIATTYGPRGRPDMIPRILIENIYNDNPIRKFGDGTATRTWVYISDIVSAFLCALRNPCGGYAEFNTGAPNSTTLNDMIDCAERVVGKKAIIEQYDVPLGDAHFVAQQSYELIRDTLGWTPKVDIEEGMRLTYLDYLRRRKEKTSHLGRKLPRLWGHWWKVPQGSGLAGLRSSIGGHRGG